VSQQADLQGYTARPSLLRGIRGVFRQSLRWGELLGTPYGIVPALMVDLLLFLLLVQTSIFRIAGPNIAQDVNLDLRTVGGLTVTDITEDVTELVKDSGIEDGIACVYSPHTTCCVRVNEFESGFLEDFAQLLRRLVPSESYYAHDDWDRRTENICPEDMDQGNGHSHCMAMLLGTAGESVPVRDGELQLGTWQRVLFIELDRERERRWLVQVVGS